MKLPVIASSIVPLALLFTACNAQTTVAANGNNGNQATSADGPAYCRHNAARALELELDGVDAIRLEVGPDTVILTGHDQPGGQLSGRACASSAELLDGLQVSQRREGGTLMVKMEQPKRPGIGIGSRYAWLDLSGQLPAGLPVTLALGSGDVGLDNIASLDAQVGSGDLDAGRVAGAIQLTLGSGDVTIKGAGSLEATVGSGDLKAEAINGVTTFTVGSGDIVLKQAGSLELMAVGSGDVTAEQVAGDVNIGAIGSGDVSLAGVTGSVNARTLASGSLQIHQVSGNLSVQSVGSGDLDYRDIGGQVQVPSKR